MSKFSVHHRDPYRSDKWVCKSSHETKEEAEQMAFALVHIKEASCAIVVEDKPVVITRVEREENGVSMTHPRASIKTPEYR